MDSAAKNIRQMTADEVLSQLLDSVRSSDVTRDRAITTFLYGLTGLVFFRFVEIEETERAAIAAFDDKEFTPWLKPSLNWERIQALGRTELNWFIAEELWPLIRYWNPNAQIPDDRPMPELVEKLFGEYDTILGFALDVVGAYDVSCSEDRKCLNEIFECFINSWSEQKRLPNAEYCTPKPLVDLVLDIAQPKAGERVYDPCFGVGSFLVGAARRIMEQSESMSPIDWQRVRDDSIFGVDINPRMQLITTARLLLAGIVHPRLECANALEREVPRDRSRNGFDCIFANPPFGMNAPERAFRQFPIPTHSGEGMFIQHILAQLRPGGRAFIVLPDGVLFRRGNEADLRKLLLHDYRVDAVIALPESQVQPLTTIKTNLLIISNQPPAEDVLFIRDKVFEAALEPETGPSVRAALVGLLRNRLRGEEALADIAGPLLSFLSLISSITNKVPRDDSAPPGIRLRAASVDAARISLDLLHLLPNAQEMFRTEVKDNSTHTPCPHFVPKNPPATFHSGWHDHKLHDAAKYWRQSEWDVSNSWARLYTSLATGSKDVLRSSTPLEPSRRSGVETVFSGFCDSLQTSTHSGGESQHIFLLYFLDSLSKSFREKEGQIRNLWDLSRSNLTSSTDKEKRRIDLLEVLDDIVTPIWDKQEDRPDTAPRYAWCSTVSSLAKRQWELVVKESGESALESFLHVLQTRKEGTQRQPLGSICDVFAGIGYEKTGLIEADKAVLQDDNKPVAPLIRVQDVTDAARKARDPESLPIIRRCSAFLNEEGLARASDKHRLIPSDILITASGTVGEMAMAGENVIGAIPAKSILVLRPKGSVSLPYLFRLLQTKPYREWLQGHAFGGTIRHLSVRALRELPIVLLPLEEQDAFAKTLSGGETTSTVLELLEKKTSSPSWLRHFESGSSLKALETGWNKATLSELSQFITEALPEVGATLSLAKEGATSMEPIPFLLDWWLTQTANILQSERIPPGPDRVTFLTMWKERLSISSKFEYLNDIPRRAEQENWAFTETAVALMNALLGALERVGDLARDSLLGSIDLVASVLPPIIDTSVRSEVEIEVSNRGSAALIDFEASTVPINSKSSTPYVEIQGSHRWTVSILPTTAGPIELELVWSANRLDGQRVSGTIDLAIEARSLRLAGKADDLGASPYVCGRPIDREDAFYGRQDKIQMIRRMLRKEGPAEVILLEGNRRTGKTSILNHLALPGKLDGWLPVICNFQGSEGDASKAGSSTEQLCYSIAKEMLIAAHKAGYELDVPNVGVIPKDVSNMRFKLVLANDLQQHFTPDNCYQFLDIVTEGVLEVLGPVGMLLMLDEFDKIEEGIQSGITSPQLPENIRNLFHAHKGLAGILTGSRRIKRLRDEYWHALFGIGNRVDVSELEEHAARNLITRPVEGRLVFATSATDKILELSARHPFLIQKLCDAVFHLCAESGERSITLSVVDTAARGLAEDNEHFSTLWDYVSCNRSRFLLCVIERMNRDALKPTVNTLRDGLEREGVAYRSLEALDTNLSDLRELELVQLQNNSYTISVPLFSRWLQENMDFNLVREKARLESEGGTV